MALSDADANKIHNDAIGLAKAILWQEAIGKLRALVMAGGNENSTRAVDRGPDWQEVERCVEAFIKDFEDSGYHE